MVHALALPALIGLIALALAFDFLNGLHDAANAIATVVSTKLLSPLHAVLFAAVGNFAAYWIVGLHVAETVGKGIVDKDAVTPAVVFGALIGAMFWNVRHLAQGHSLLVQPRPDRRAARRRDRACRAERGRAGRHQQDDPGDLPVAADRLGHRDAADAGDQLVLQGHRAAQGRPHVQGAAPDLVGRLFDQPRRQRRAEDDGDHRGAALFDRPSRRRVPRARMGGDRPAMSRSRSARVSGGWKIIKTMGTGLTKLNHHSGFCASTAGSIVVFGASAMGIPISTTHAITGSVVGTGAARRASAVRWSTASRVIVAWFITIPASAGGGGGVLPADDGCSTDDR